MNDVLCSALAEQILHEIELCKSMFPVCPSDWDEDEVPCPYGVKGLCDKCMTYK